MGWDAIADYYINRPIPIYEPPPPPIQVNHEERQETTEETDAETER